jgi:hypothetical protein
MTTRRPALGVEGLERRDTPAFTATLVGTTATLLGDGAADKLVLTVSGGFLEHGRRSAGELAFASDADWDSTAAGDQKLPADSTSKIDITTLGGGDDLLHLGTPASPARTLLAHIKIASAGLGNDNLIVDNSGSADADTYDYTATQTTAMGLNFTNDAVFENGELYRCGTGADTFNVRTANQNLTIEGGGGTDTVTVGNAKSMVGVVSKITVGNDKGKSTLALDDSETATADTVAVTSTAKQTTVAGLSAGSVVFDNGEVSMLTVSAGSGDDAFTYEATTSDLTATIRGGGGKDSFAVDTSGGTNSTLALEGEGGNDAFAVNAVPGDSFRVVIKGGEGTDLVTAAPPEDGTPVVTHTSAETGAAVLAAESFRVEFEKVEGVSLTGPLATVTVNLPSAKNEGVVLGDDGGAADADGVAEVGVSLLSGPFTGTEFANPTTALVVNLGNGGDTITMALMDGTFAPTGGTTLAGGTGADTFTIQPDTNSRILVSGNNPASVSPGDTLRIPSLVNDTAQTTPTGVFGTAPGTVTYQGIETLDVPPPPPVIENSHFGVGTDRGGATVRFFNPDGTERFTLSPFGPQFSGGVRVASADFSGDGVADLVVGTGPGGATVVSIFDGVSKALLFTTPPFEPTFTGGVYVAAGDITGDGTPELVITPDEGGGPRVKIFNGVGFTLLADFFGIDDAGFRGGARAAVGAINDDAFGDLVVCAGFGGGPRVAAFDGETVTTTRDKLFNDFFVFEEGLRNGAFIAVGDVNADGFGDLVGGGGPGGAPRVLILSGADLLAGKGEQSAIVSNFFGGDVNSRGGIRVGTRNLNADDNADVVVGAGEGAGSRVVGLTGAALTAGTPAEVFAFDAFPEFTGGTFVG